LVEEALEEPEVDLPADIGAAASSSQIDAEAGAGAGRLEAANRFGLALEHGGRQFVVPEDRLCRVVGCKSDRDPALRGNRLDPRRRVDRVAGDEVLTRARGHAEP